MSEPPSTSPRDRLRAAIESTALGFDVTAERVERLCDEALRLGVGGVCVPPALVVVARERLGSGSPRVVTVAGFPFGDAPGPVLRSAARAARDAGADGVDAVFPLHCIPARDWSAAGRLLDALERGLDGAPYRLILETAVWNPDTLDDLLTFLRGRGVSAVKTSTGFHPAGGATVEAVRSLRSGLPAPVEIKAAGGIRTRSGAIALLDAGADALGTSSAASLLDEG